MAPYPERDDHSRHQAQRRGAQPPERAVGDSRGNTTALAPLEKVECSEEATREGGGSPQRQRRVPALSDASGQLAAASLGSSGVQEAARRVYRESVARGQEQLQLDRPPRRVRTRL